MKTEPPTAFTIPLATMYEADSPAPSSSVVRRPPANTYRMPRTRPTAQIVAADFVDYSTHDRIFMVSRGLLADGPEMFADLGPMRGRLPLYLRGSIERDGARRVRSRSGINT